MYRVPSCQSNPRRNPTFLPCLWIIPPCIIRATLHWPISLTFRVIPYKKQKNLNIINTTTLQSVHEILNYLQALSLSWCSNQWVGLVLYWQGFYILKGSHLMNDKSEIISHHRLILVFVELDESDTIDFTPGIHLDFRTGRLWGITVYVDKCLNRRRSDSHCILTIHLMSYNIMCL